MYTCVNWMLTFKFVPSSIKAKNSPCIAPSWSCSGLAFGTDECHEHRPIFSCLGHSSPHDFALSMAWSSFLKVRYSFKVILSVPGISWTRLDLLLCPDLCQRLTPLTLFSYRLSFCLLTPLLVICKCKKFMLTGWEVLSLNFEGSFWTQMSFLVTVTYKCLFYKTL